MITRDLALRAAQEERRCSRHSWTLTVATVALGVATSCSYFNREGPDVTCADLDNGRINACQDGIIATCHDGRVNYQVCTEAVGGVEPNDLCGAAWQQQGAYSCGQGAAGTGGAAGSGGSAGTGGTSGGTGGTSGSGGAGCTKDCLGGACVDGQCQPVQISGYPYSWGNIQDCHVALDATFVYVGGTAFDVGRVPKSGGTPVSLSQKQTSKASRVAVDDHRVYWTEHFSGDLHSVPKSGGAQQEYAGGVDSFGLALDADYAYWGGSYRISRMQKASGIVEEIVELPSGDNVIYMAKSGADLFWCEYPGVLRVIVPGEQAWTTLATEAAGVNGCRFVVADSWVYWTSADDLRAMSREGGQITTLATASESLDHDYSSIATDGEALYICGKYGVFVNYMNSAPPYKLVTFDGWPWDACRDIAVDEDAVYWCDNSGLWRVAR